MATRRVICSGDSSFTWFPFNKIPARVARFPVYLLKRTFQASTGVSNQGHQGNRKEKPGVFYDYPGECANHKQPLT